MNKNVIITEYSSYDIFYFIEQAEILLKNNNNYHDHLIKLQNEITKMIQNKQLSQIEQSVLGYLQATLSSLIMRYNSAHEKGLVVNLEKYLQLTFSQINSWTSLFKQNLTEVYRLNYENNLKNKIQESNNQIEMLRKDIQIYQNELNQDLFRIIDEISQLKKEFQENDLRLINKKEDN
jgi:predicted RNase H-like nuclease (RuvC/YqgF family)